jgi:hypothetical protein
VQAAGRNTETASVGIHSPGIARLHELVRTRPELLLGPFAVLFLVVNVGPWGFGSKYIVTFFLFFTLQRSNAIFPLTWSLSVALFIAGLWLFLRARQLPWWRSFLLAGTLPFLAVSLFEVPYDLCVVGTYPHSGVSSFDLLSISTWLAVGFTSIGWWRLTRRYWALFVGFFGTYAVWFAVGFPTIDRASGGALAVAFAFNIVLKIACFPLAGLPVWEELRRLPQSPSATSRTDPL